MLSGRLVPGRAVVPRFRHRAGALQILGTERYGRIAPGDRLTREKQRLRKVPTYELEIVEHGDDGTTVALPLGDDAAEMRDCRVVDGNEWFVEENDRSVLEDHAGEQ